SDSPDRRTRCSSRNIAMCSAALKDADAASALDPASQIPYPPATSHDTSHPKSKAAPPTQTPAPDHRPSPLSQDHTPRSPQGLTACPTAAPPPWNRSQTRPPPVHEKCADRSWPERKSCCARSDLQSSRQTGVADRWD